MRRITGLLAVLILVSGLSQVTAGVVYQQTMDATWLNANATFFAGRPHTPNLPTSIKFVTNGSVHYEKILEVPLFAPGALSSSRLYTVDIAIDCVPLTADNEFTVGVRDGTDVVAVMRSENSGGTAFLSSGTSGATLVTPDSPLVNLGAGLGLPQTYSAQLVLGAQTEGSAIYPATTKTGTMSRRVRPANGLTLVSWANGPAEQYEINSLAVTVTESDTDEVLHYTFDTAHTAGTTVKDISGNRNDGTMVGAPTSTPAAPFGEALSLNGTSAISVGKALLSTTDPNQPYTIGFWTRSDSGSGILTQYASGADADRFGIRTDRNSGKPTWWSSADDAVASTTDATDGAWHHVAFTKDASQNLRVYVDGVDETPAGTPKHADDFAPQITEIGWFNSGLVPHTGDLDELWVFDRALSHTEVRNLRQYNMPQPTILHYSLDSNDISGSTVTDLSGAGNNGTNVGADAVGQGAFGQALNFGAGEYVTVGKALLSQTDAYQPYTIAAWVKSDAGAGGGFVTQYDGSPHANRFGLRTDHDYPTWWHNATDDVVATSDVNTDQQWHHVAFVKDAQQNLRVYVDGVDETPAGTPKHASAFSDAYTEIGRFSSSTINNFGGSIDEVFVFPRPLSSDEITNLCRYNTVQPLLLHYSFDAKDVSGTGAGSTVTDLSPEENHGTVKGTGTAIVSGAPFGQALTFSGANAVSVGKALLSTTDDDQPYTVAFWMRMDPSSDGGGLLTQYATSGPDYGKRMGIRVWDDGEVSWWSGGTDNLRSGGAVNDGTWHHIAFVKDSWQNLHLYVDGVNVTSTATGPGTHTMSIMDHLTEIGAFDAGFVGFEGDLDEMWVFRAGLSPTDIHNLWIANSLVPEPTTLALLGLGLLGVARRRKLRKG